MTSTNATNATTDTELLVDETAEVQGFLNPQPIPPGRQADYMVVRPSYSTFASQYNDRAIIVVGGRQQLPPQYATR
jgi:hypothetical protein